MPACHGSSVTSFSAAQSPPSTTAQAVRAHEPVRARRDHRRPGSPAGGRARSRTRRSPHRAGGRWRRPAQAAAAPAAIAAWTSEPSGEVTAPSAMSLMPRLAVPSGVQNRTRLDACRPPGGSSARSKGIRRARVAAPRGLEDSAVPGRDRCGALGTGVGRMAVGDGLGGVESRTSARREGQKRRRDKATSRIGPWRAPAGHQGLKTTGRRCKRSR